MTVILAIKDPFFPEGVTPRLYKLQYGFANAFFDLFVTEKGKAKDPRVVDYYGEEEPIELGPDENMHDSMIELMAEQALKRGYPLGIGVMSSKRVGINHKEYGVTSRGVVKFAEVAMKELGVDIHRDPFTVKITGGPNGDVAGNSMKILLARCRKMRILAVAAGSGALYDPEGVEGKELKRLILKKDIVDFNPEKLHPGGFIIFRGEFREDGIRKLQRRVARTHKGVEESWITVDEFHREFDHLVFSVAVDLFLPCGGRPETIDGKTWQKMLDKDGTPAARVIVEGANSYITPDAREALQKRGMVIIRDASANKCGVISSSYEIIANLLMGEKEFLENKEAYVRDVLRILEKRAEEEANLLFRRHRENNAGILYTDISDAISREINEHYMRLFPYFHDRPELADKPVYRRVLLNHLPAFLRENRKYKARIKKMPLKIRSAILAVEIATSIVYRGDRMLILK
jgi:glutamate dehydrogenase